MNTFGDALDPERNNIGSIDLNTESQELITVDDAGCYRAYGINFEGNVIIEQNESFLKGNSAEIDFEKGLSSITSDDQGLVTGVFY